LINIPNMVIDSLVMWWCRSRK